VEVNSEVPQFVVELSEPSQAGEARRAAVACAEQLGLNETERGAVAIAATEMATNVLKHARNGQILCQALGANGRRGLRLISLDHGPGIRNLTAALEDGFSTAGTVGSGLGALQRLSSRFDVYTVPDHGTCIVAEFEAKNVAPQEQSALQVGVVCLPVRGETTCGDAWIIKPGPQRVTLMLVDGLGHGVFAAEAAHEAVRIVNEAQSSSPSSLLHDCHDALRKTRGAAVAIATIDLEKQTLSFAGLGNIAASLLTPERGRGLASHNGTAGHHLHRTQEFTFPWTEQTVLIMHSDGLATRWDLKEYPGIWARDASVIAAVLYRDFARERDDTTVLVAKNSVCP
jgi:anti-sigma regulatory factor (Ser/Thr protein kinase)